PGSDAAFAGSASKAKSSVGTAFQSARFSASIVSANREPASQTTTLAAASVLWSAFAPANTANKTSDRVFSKIAPFLFSFWYEFINRIFENDTILTRLCMEARGRLAFRVGKIDWRVYSVAAILAAIPGSKFRAMKTLLLLLLFAPL